MSSNEKVKHLQIPLKELSDATNGFSERNLLARGGFGKVYNGVSVKLGNIAVKMLDPRLGQGDHEFTTEIALLSVYKHENIVSLLGFCDEDEQKILVYKYESNGSLDKHLKRTDLTWIQRLQICLDAARGLKYLHDDVGAEHRILHRDVKSSNILLDENWKAKISDFGLSRVGPANKQSTFLISNACGTIGYIDPDFLNTGYLTQKSDVYSFGVVLFEVLCGRPTIVTKYKDNRDFLTNLIKTHWRRKNIDEIVYPDLQKQIKTASLATFTTIAYQCLMSGNERPAMNIVVEKLQKALNNQLAPSEILSDDDDDDNEFTAPLQGQFSELLQASSSQSSPAPASSSESWWYDVFISFRGEDTCKTFVNPLYSALVNRKIFTCIEDTILFQRGEPNVESVFKAIKESRIVIIVFSRIYATSPWSLDELAFIMKNNKRGQLILPIFYDVLPSEVRSQTGLFGNLFSDSNLLNKNKMEYWREALVSAGGIAGWDLNNTLNRHKWKFIKRICDDISYRLLSFMPHFQASAETSANTYIISIETRMQELKSLLEELGSGGVHMVGICSMWGSGKSTLASSIYDEISHEFEGCCFVTNVRAESRMYGLKTLQERILSDVLKSKVILKSIEHGIDMMKRRLHRNNVLIVLDDVDHIDQLKMLAGSKTWFGDGSRIIVTTRNKGLVNANGYLTHNVRMLDVKEAIELFSWHAFGERKPAHGFQKVLLNMVSKFGGHPLTLISLGSFLYGKDTSVWIGILDRLAGIPVDEILKKFETRDDGLPTNILLDFLVEEARAMSVP